MTASLLLPWVVGQSTAGGPVLLKRSYQANEKLAYAVRSSLHSDRRGGALVTWLPEDMDVNYDFSLLFEKVKADGIAVLRYRRPTITEIEGETFDAPSKSNVMRVDMDARLTLSPFNEILDVAELGTKKSMYPMPVARQDEGQDIVSSFFSEIGRLALFVGNLDSALDLAPRTPFDPVKIGDTWKRTVGYQPQKLKGKNEQAVQRLDYTYTFKGMVDGDKGKVLRVEASLNFSNDLAEFLKQITESDLGEQGIDKIPMKLSATILYDLDPKSKITLKADAHSEASIQIFRPNHDTALYEEKLKGHTSLALVGRAIVSPTPVKKH